MDHSGRDYHAIDPPDSVVRVVQLTDTHLCRRAGGTLLAMDTDHSLQAVIDRVLRERERVDLVLGTGDLADGGAREAYERLLGYFTQVTEHHYWLSGNHDDRAAMESVLDRPERLSRELRVGGWQILMLDSQVPGEVGGELGPDEIAALERALAAAEQASLHTLVCLHHQPVEVGCEWLDEQMVADAGRFFAVLERHPGVRGVLWGHVHQEIDRDYRGIRLMASPSTCIQFAPGSANFRADDLPPGYRWLDLYEDGRIDTGVSRVTDVAFTVDLESGGYL
jgi:Icc protein